MRGRVPRADAAAATARRAARRGPRRDPRPRSRRCIHADFGDQTVIFQHFSRSTRFAILRTARNAKNKSRIAFEDFAIFAKFRKILLIFSDFVRKEKFYKNQQNFAKFPSEKMIFL